MVEPLSVNQPDAPPLRAPDGSAYLFDQPPARAEAERRVSLGGPLRLRKPERRLYEEVVRAVWALAIDGLRPAVTCGFYLGWQVALRMPAAIAVRAERTPPATQEALLAAFGCRFERGVYGPIEPGCPCDVCRPRERLRAELEGTPAADHLRGYFAFVLARHLEVALKAPDAYDHHLGAPLAVWGSPPDPLKAAWREPFVRIDRPRKQRGCKSHPSPVGWRAAPEPDPELHRSLYERWAPLADGLVTGPLTPTPDGGYCSVNLEDRLEPVACHMASAVVPVDEQLAFLRAGPSGPPLLDGAEADPATEVGRWAIRRLFAAVLADQLGRSHGAASALGRSLGTQVEQRWPILPWPGGRTWAAVFG